MSQRIFLNLISVFPALVSCRSDRRSMKDGSNDTQVSGWRRNAVKWIGCLCVKRRFDSTCLRLICGKSFVPTRGTNLYHRHLTSTLLLIGFARPKKQKECESARPTTRRVIFLSTAPLEAHVLKCVAGKTKNS